MILTTLESIPGKQIVRICGLVRGNTVRAKHIGKDILAGLKQIVGGEIKGYTEMMTEAREQAIERMVAEAEALGANAVVGMRLTTADVMQSASEVLAYGTAVVM
ncbi:MAG TPA: YbjQ family protein [Acidobacteriota bacterium]|nr:YbjQ family protein [Acidobacteriota bacterium]